MRIAIIGSGNIGGTLARKFAAARHQVVLGVRDPAKAEVQSLLKERGANARATQNYTEPRTFVWLLTQKPWTGRLLTLAAGSSEFSERCGHASIT